MAEESEASYQLGMPRKPAQTDELVAWIRYRDVHLRVVWKAKKHDDLLNLLHSLTENNFWEQARAEYEVAVASDEIDGDLDFLFGEAEVEDDE